MSKTWAPKGQTPILRHNFGHWHKINLVSAVCHDGSLHFQTRVGKSFKHPDIAAFLEHLLRYEEGEIVLFWDGANQHKGPEIRRVLAENPRLHVEWLPPYGFEYNPDEGVWDHLKWAELRNFTPKNTGENLTMVRKAMHRIRRRKKLIAAFFLNTKLPRKDVKALLELSGRL